MTRQCNAERLQQVVFKVRIHYQVEFGLCKFLEGELIKIHSWTADIGSEFATIIASLRRKRPDHMMRLNLDLEFYHVIPCRFLGTEHQLATNLGLQLVDDFGFSKNYVRHLQVKLGYSFCLNLDHF